MGAHKFCEIYVLHKSKINVLFYSAIYWYDISFLQLLELPQFQDIIKIKTIGSTYMAASGLNPSRQVKVKVAYGFNYLTN